MSERKKYQNKELMLAAGSKNGAYDPEAPDQWRYVLLHGRDAEEVAMAWVKSKTTAHGHDSPFCVDEHGKTLHTKHLAADTGWKLHTAENVLCGLDSQGRIRLEKGKRIWYCADIPKAQEQPDDSEDDPPPTLTPEEEARRKKSERISFVQRSWGTYVADFIDNLLEKQQEASFAKLEACKEWRREFLADGMAALRNIADRVDDTTLQEIGIPKRRLKKRRPEKTKWVAFKLLKSPSFVQGSLFEDSQESVQSEETGSYKVENDFVDARARSSTAATATAPSSAVSSSSAFPDKEKKRTGELPKPDDDEKPKPEYANAREEVKAIYLAKTGEHAPVRMLDQIEAILVSKGRNYGDYLDVLRPHLGNSWKNPGGFLTHVAKTGFDARVSPPQEKPKPKCPTCKADNQRGAILRNGVIVACPDCSTPEWRDELTAKLKRQGKANAATGD